MCIPMASERIDMDKDEFKAIRLMLIQTGLHYQKDDEGVWVQLPQVTTQGERELHLQRLRPIVKKLNTERAKQRDAWKREAKANLKKFA